MKVLIIRFSSIGDIVLTSPVIRCIKQQLQGAEVHYITKEQYLPVIKHNPFIDKTWAVSKGINDIVPGLKKERFDVVIDLHHNLRSFRLKSKLKIKSHSFHKLNIEKWLMVNLKKDKLPDKHIVDRYMETVSSLGVKNDSCRLDYFITEEDEKACMLLPETFRNYIAFAIGAQHNTKKLPAEKIISICKKLNSPVVLLGGKEDEKTADEIVSRAGSLVFNACGKFSINQSAALVKHAQFVITHDTGLMHIAAAFGKKIVSVWGNTIPKFGMYPYMPGNEKAYKIAEVNGLSCRPCSKIGYKECPKKHFRCMHEIDEESIVHWIKEGF